MCNVKCCEFFFLKNSRKILVEFGDDGNLRQTFFIVADTE